METAPPPAGLDLSLDELIGAGRRKESGGGGRKGGGRSERGGGRRSGGRGERAPRHEDGDGGHGPARRRGSVLDRLGPPLGGGGAGRNGGSAAYNGGGSYSSPHAGRGRGRGHRATQPERAPRPPPGPHKQHESVARGMDGSAVLSYDSCAIVTALPSGELVLDSGGVAEVQASMEEALSLFGLKLSASAADASAWSVSDGRAFLKRFEDGMIVPCLSQPGPGRALALLADHGDEDAKAELEAMGGLGGGAAAQGFGGRGGRGGFGGGRGRGRGPPRYSPY